MKSISLKVMTLLMAALVLSAGGCSNENEMSSPEGIVKGFYKAINKEKYINFEKMQSYWDPARVPDKNTIARWYEDYCYSIADERSGGNLNVDELRRMSRGMASRQLPVSISNVKTTLVSERVGKVWKGDKWHTQKQATVEVSCKLNEENAQATVKLVKLDNKWYIERWSGF